MPNGYTAGVYDGDASLRNYLMRVGRGMGFAVMQRDDNMDEPIKEVGPSGYYDRRIKEIDREIARLQALSPAEAEDEAAADYEDAHHKYLEDFREFNDLRDRYYRLITQVEKWEPGPLLADTDIKKTALEYLRQSLDFDCGHGFYGREPAQLVGAEWRAGKLLALYEDRRNAVKHKAEDEARNAERNRYIRAFLAALPED